MELPNPSDPSDSSAPAAPRPRQGGRDRHFCIRVPSLDPLVAKLEAAGIEYARASPSSSSSSSPSSDPSGGNEAVSFRDPDANVIECVAARP